MTPEEATKCFYAHVWPKRASVLRTAGFLCGNATEAEDLTQETLLKAFRAIESFDMNTNAQAWLSTILRHTHIDRLRSGARWADHVNLDALVSDPADTRPTTAMQDPTDPVAMLEQFSDACIIDELQQLPMEIRWSLLLVDIEQMPYEDASRILDVPSGTVKSRVHRGRQMLREKLLNPERETGTAAGRRKP